MFERRRIVLRAAVSLCAGAMLPVRAAEPGGAVALSVRRLGRLPSNAKALPPEVNGDEAEIAREQGGWPWIAYRAPLLTNADIVSAEVVPVGRDDAQGAPHAIRLTLTPRARQAWARTTLALVEQDVGVFLDGRVQGGITIRSPMAQGLFEFRVHGASRDELQRIATGLMKAPVDCAVTSPRCRGDVALMRRRCGLDAALTPP